MYLFMLFGQQGTESVPWTAIGVLAALIFSIVSICFSAFTWRKQGPIIRVTGQYTHIYMGPEKGGNHFAIRVRVENHGRGSVQVLSWSLMSRHNKAGKQRVGIGGGPDKKGDDGLPLRLEGNSRAQWHWSLVDDAFPMLDDFLGDEVRVEVRLGGHKPARSKWMKFPARSHRRTSSEINEAMTHQNPNAPSLGRSSSPGLQAVDLLVDPIGSDGLPYRQEDLLEHDKSSETG